MKPVSFAKLLSANDVGDTGSHQAGILVPKTDTQLLSFFPALDPRQLNPDAWIQAVDEHEQEWSLRYIYYNKRLHAKGTRNEYRLTHLTAYLRSVGARPGDLLVFSIGGAPGQYRISLQSRAVAATEDASEVIRLKGWRRVH